MWGETPKMPKQTGRKWDFNPLTPCGVRRPANLAAVLIKLFQSTHPVWGETAKSIHKKNYFPQKFILEGTFSLFFQDELILIFLQEKYYLSFYKFWCEPPRDFMIAIASHLNNHYILRIIAFFYTIMFYFR